MAKYYQDFVGLNTFVYEPHFGGSVGLLLVHDVDYSRETMFPTATPRNNITLLNTRGLFLNEASRNQDAVEYYLNYEFAKSTMASWADAVTQGDPSVFNSLVIYRNGPFGWPMWKQIRGNENPIIRKQKQNNIFTYIEEPGDSYNVTIAGKTYNQINKYGKTKVFMEPCVTDAFKPLELVASVEPPESLRAAGISSGLASIKTTFGNDTVFFANDEINRDLETFEESDESYENFKELYLDGALDEDSSPLDEFRMLVYSQTIWPKPENSFLKRTRQRSLFVSKFWRDRRTNRTETKVKVFNTIIQSQSMWPLDVDTTWQSRTMPSMINFPPVQFFCGYNGGEFAPTLNSSAQPEGDAGILMNRYSNFWSEFTFNSLGQPVPPSTPGNMNRIYDRLLSASCVYAYEHTLNSIRSAESNASQNNYPSGYDYDFLATNPPYRDWRSITGGHSVRGEFKFSLQTLFQTGQAAWDAGRNSNKQPFYDSYSEYSEKIRLKGQGYSIIPEFRMSIHVEDYIKKSVTDELENIFELSGALGTNTTSTEPEFYQLYSTSEFLKHFEIIKKDHEGFTKPAAITLKCKAIKKFLPYEGFYPAQRTVQLAQEFHKSIKDYVKTQPRLSKFSQNKGPFFNSKIGTQFIMEPLFAPGVLFNSIKAGVACDFPVITNDQRAEFVNTDHASRLDPNSWQGNIKSWPSTSGYGILRGSITGKIDSFENTLWAWDLQSTPLIVPSVDLNGAVGGLYRKNGINLNGIYERRVPFEALLEPERWLSDVNLGSQQPHYNAASNPGGWNLYANWDGTGNEIYKKFASNFLAEVPEFFLQGENFSTIASAESGDPSFGNAVSGSFYGMRIKMYRTRNGFKTELKGFDGQGVTPPQVLRGLTNVGGLTGVEDYVNSAGGSNIQMYSRPSAFGPPTWGGGGTGHFYYLKGEYAATADLTLLNTPPVEYGERTSDSTEGYNMPYTPPYTDGEAWCDVMFEATESRKYSLDEILGQVQSFPYYTRFWWNGINDALRDLTGYNVPSAVSGASSWNRDHYWSYMGEDRRYDGPYKEYKSQFGCPWSNLIFNSRNARFSTERVGPYPTWAKPNDYLAGSRFVHDPDQGNRFPTPRIANINPLTGEYVGGQLNATLTDWGDQRYTDGWWQLSGAYAGPPTLIPGKSSLQQPDNTGDYTNRDGIRALRAIRAHSPWRVIFGGGFKGLLNNPTLYPHYIYAPQHPFYINSNAMQLNSSLNLFTKGKVRKQNLMGDFSAVKQDVATAATNDSQSRWIIQSKFETPILNFNNFKDSKLSDITMPDNFGRLEVPRGMWHQYGTIPSGSNEGVFMQVTDIPYSWLRGALGVSRAKRKVKSLADLVGFSKKPARLGEVAKVKEIGELVVAIPFVERMGVRVYFSVPRKDIDRAISGLNQERAPGIFIDDRGNRVRPPMVGKSVVDQVRLMRKYNFPPSMDFVKYDQIDPFAAYCFEFTHNLNKQDLADIWQNLPPQIGREFQEATSTVSHQLLAKDLMGGGAQVSQGLKGESSSQFDINEPGNELDSKIQWMVFKCKKKAASNYYDKVLTKKGTTRDTKEFKLENVKTAAVGKDEEITFNWPYDYFSLVELVKIDATVVFADLQPESEQAIPKPKKKSIERRNKRRMKGCRPSKKGRGKKKGGRFKKLRDKAKKWWSKRDTREERKALRKERRENRKSNRKERKSKRKSKRKNRKSKRKNR
jgi:hypothetical protein